MGLGPVADVSLAHARGLAGACRRQLQEGVDPIEARRAQRTAAQLEAANAITFQQCAEAYFAAHKPGWRSAKHARQWTSTLKAYAYPVFGALPVQQIDVALVMRMLEPIWTAKTVTAGRVRGRVEVILDWAATRGYRRGENPARWKGHLENLLPKRSKVSKVKHHPALPYREIGTFMAALRTEEGAAAQALEFTILTAACTSEVTGARRGELASEAKIWTVPEGRTKGEKEHRVPLSAPASIIAKHMLELDGAEFIFPGGRAKKPLSENAMLALLERMGHNDITVHGFRSTFRDWAAEQTNYSREVAETALAHVIEDKVEGAYRRGDLFEKRRRLMDEWARFCATPVKSGKVVPIRGVSE
ncbi:MAG TPA: tyrosine-type recombinase/integrase [Dongiaceae bacterium]|nr:tyrosine-type recombinase/integrase [Dongiaceae bacterium]